MEIEEVVKSIIEKPINELGYILDDVNYIKEGTSYFLRIIIDKVGYITIDDCVKVNNLVSPLLDEKDPIVDSYILDVCSKEKGCDKHE